jgi:hypothetical protein
MTPKNTSKISNISLEVHRKVISKLPKKPREYFYYPMGRKIKDAHSKQNED